MPNLTGGRKRRSRRSTSPKRSRRSASPKRSRRSRKSHKKSGGKRKPTPYINFMKNYFKKHKGEDVTKVVKKGAAEWRSMSDAEKKKYK